MFPDPTPEEHDVGKRELKQQPALHKHAYVQHVVKGIGSQSVTVEDMCLQDITLQNG